MANTNQAKKMVRKTKKRTQYNRWWKAKVKKSIKDLDKLLGSSTKSQADLQKQFSVVQENVDKASKNNIIHPNKANRIKSSFSKKVDQISNKK